MARMLGVILAGLGIAGFAVADECCKQGNALPWKAYNSGIRWRAALGKDPGRWKVQAESSLAEREKALTEHVKRAAKDGWKDALQPVLETARRENKLVLFFQLVGDLDLEGC